MEDFIGFISNGKIYDLQQLDFFKDEKKYFLNRKDGLSIIRHSCAHLLAQALCRLYENVHLATGPDTDNGFFHDFQCDKQISSNELSAIEDEMYKIIEESLDMKREEISKKNAEILFKNDPLKMHIMENISEPIIIYKQGEFSTLCTGPHLLNTKLIGDGFCLDSISEVEWHGKKLQRITGFAFEDESKLNEFLLNLAKAKEVDHRNLAKRMELFYTDPIAPGFVFWRENGLKIFRQMQKEVRHICYKGFFQEVSTPLICKQELWEKTGHLKTYKEHMFLTEDSAIKPMNCPAHTIMFKKEIRSYKELPLRIGEFGTVLRNEEIGALNGLKRTRCLTQDDGHIFCTLDQVSEEVKIFLNGAFKLYKKFGIDNVRCVLATRPDKRIGEDFEWDIAERNLMFGMEEMGLSYTINEGEGAFYGPKIELHLLDNLSRSWQCGTLQLDMFIAKNLDATFINKDGEKDYPIVLHRASFGSLERFMAIMLEHNGGNLPLWLAPIQVAILPVAEKHKDFALDVSKNFDKVLVDYSAETVGKKVKEAIMKKIPIIMVVGDKEIVSGKFLVRYNGKESSQTLEEVLKIISDDF